MSSRLLNVAVACFEASSAALVCTGAKAKSADGSQQQSVSTALKVRGG